MLKQLQTEKISPDEYIPKKSSEEYYELKYEVDKDAHGAGLSVLTIGDPHFKMENMSDVNVFISRIITVIKSEKPDFVVVLGDLLHNHERVHTTVMNKAFEFIHKIRQHVQVYVLVGNHDMINNSQFLTDNHWMNAMKVWDNVFIVDKGMVRKTQYGDFIFCPYVFPGKFEEALDIIHKDWRDARAIFCHQEFYGVKMGAINSEIGDKWELDNPFIISGHIHDKQRVSDNILYTGSSIQHAFGESSNKTISMCHFDFILRIEHLNLDLPTKKIIYKDMDNINNYNVSVNCKDHIRITLSGTCAEFKQFKKSKKYKDLIQKGVKIQFRHKEIEAVTNIVTDNFYDILYKLVVAEKNHSMLDMYNEIFIEN